MGRRVAGARLGDAARESDAAPKRRPRLVRRRLLHGARHDSACRVPGRRRGTHRDVAIYEWTHNHGKAKPTPVQWDPYNCAGPSDGVKDCSTPDHPDWTIQNWYDMDGTVYIEPGFQIYEDPDPQGSPGVLSLVGIPQNDPYPLPALYFGTCGAVLGGDGAAPG